MKHIKPVDKYDIGRIERAYHSYPIIPYYDFNVDGHGMEDLPFKLKRGYKLVRFIIPKGAKYYTGYNHHMIIIRNNHNDFSSRRVQVPYYASNMIISGDLQDERHLIESLTSLEILGLNEYGEITEERRNAKIDRLIEITSARLVDKK